MAAKKGQKRKAPGATAASKAAASSSTTNGNTDLTPPDRNTWPGWVEMESEPAFFNGMLEDMGVRGVRIHEVYSMEANELAFLPQPVHALIFLFRYKTSVDQQARDKESPETNHIWFANQIPDFACASVALLNIVNNIPDLEMSKELRDFKDFTKDLDPFNRGYAIDTFDFVRKIHNSFARDSDLLQADTHMKNKMAVYKRKEAAAKGLATKAAKKAAAQAAPLQEKSVNATTRSGRTTQRSRRAAEDAEEASSPAEKSTRSRKSSIDPDDIVKPEVKKGKRKSDDLDGDFEPGAKKLKTRVSLTEDTIKEEDDELGDGDDDAEMNGVDDSLSKPNGTENDAQDDDNTSPTTNGIKKPAPNARRSARARKPPKKSLTKDDDELEDEPEEGFHFIAYMPIGDHVWKLDGLNYLPEDMGSFGFSGNGADGGSGNWLDAASPAIMNRMADFEGASIEFNLMAVVHDPAIKDKSDLIRNVKALQAVEKKLTACIEDWYEMDGGETKAGVVKGMSTDFDITLLDIDAAEMPAGIEKELGETEGLLELLAIRTRLLGQQEILRAGLRSAIVGMQAEREKARHRRHNYTPFLRHWMGALAESEVLGSLIDG